MSKRFFVVIVHVIDDPGLLIKGERVPGDEFVGFDPEDLAESADETDAHGFQAEEREVVSLFILPGRRKVSKVTLSNGRLRRSQWTCICDASDAAASLHVHVNTVSQRLERIGALLGPSWQQPEESLELRLALRLRRLLVQD